MTFAFKRDRGSTILKTICWKVWKLQTAILANISTSGFSNFDFRTTASIARKQKKIEHPSSTGTALQRVRNSNLKGQQTNSMWGVKFYSAMLFNENLLTLKMNNFIKLNGFFFSTLHCTIFSHQIVFFNT